MNQITVYARIRDCRGHTVVAVADKPMTPDEWVLEVSRRIDEGEVIVGCEVGTALIPVRDVNGLLKETPVLFRDPMIIDYITGHIA